MEVLESTSLGKVVYLPCAHHSPWKTPTNKPEGVVWHFTNTAWGTGESMQKRMATTPKATGSFHLSIDYDGTVYQSVPFSRASWHANSKTALKFKRSFSGLYTPARSKLSANGWTIGIELVSPGSVKKVGDKWRGWPYTEAGPAVRTTLGGEVIKYGGRTWAQYAPAQYLKAQEVLTQLNEAFFKLLPVDNLVWGHSTIDPNRRDDPGGFFLDWVKGVALSLPRGGR